jgi:hypothetical protein
MSHDGFAIGIAGFIRLAATLIGQKPDQTLHSVKAGAIEQKPAFTTYGDKPCVLQLLQMERQGWGCNAEFVSEHAGRKSFGSPLHQQTEQRKTGILSKSAQGFHNFSGFHIFIVVELSLGRQVLKDVRELSQSPCRVQS